jgi:hypothetical protein
MTKPNEFKKFCGVEHRTFTVRFLNYKVRIGKQSPATPQHFKNSMHLQIFFFKYLSKSFVEV